MVGIISRRIQQFKQDWTIVLDQNVIVALCHEIGHHWRERVLGPVLTLRLFLLQILHGNTACAHLPHLAGLRFSDTAYCEARKRLPLKLFEMLLTRSAARLTSGANWLGHRVLLTDGSGFSMPDAPELQEYFGQPGGQPPGCGFPVATWLCLMHYGSGMIRQSIAAPLCRREIQLTPQLHPLLKPGDVLVADRGFCSFAHLALLIQQGVHAVFRVQQRMIVDFTPGRSYVDPRRNDVSKQVGMPRSRWVRSLGNKDQLVEWIKPRYVPNWMEAQQYAALPEAITVRELQYQVRRKGFRSRRITLVTTLNNPQRYPQGELAELYRRRWEIETNFRHLKTTMRMDVLRCRSLEGIRKELMMFALVYNLVRAVMLQAARRQRVPVERVSFCDALRWLLRPGSELDLVALKTNPNRPGRYEPRRRKRTTHHYPTMQKPRHHWRQLLLNQRDTS